MNVTKQVIIAHTEKQVEDLRSFIRTLLISSGIDSDNAIALTSNEVHSTLYTNKNKFTNMERFKLVFTHRSANNIFNYEYEEFFGDSSVNEFLPYYIRQKFPDMINVNWLSKMLANLKSKKVLAYRSVALGFDKHVLYDKLSIKRGNTEESDKEYMSMLEDVFEAFTACIIFVMEDMGFAHGTAVQVNHTILKYAFDKMYISDAYKDVFDSVTRFKELCENPNVVGLTKWPIAQAYHIDKKLPPDNRTRVTVYGWPLGDKSPIPANREVLAVVEGKGQAAVKKKAASEALDTLRLNYNIVEKMYSSNEKDTSAYKKKKEKPKQDDDDDDDGAYGNAVYGLNLI